MLIAHVAFQKSRTDADDNLKKRAFVRHWSVVIGSSEWLSCWCHAHAEEVIKSSGLHAHIRQRVREFAIAFSCGHAPKRAPLLPVHAHVFNRGSVG